MNRDRVREALRCIDELAFQMTHIMTPEDTHPNVGAIRDWVSHACAALEDTDAEIKEDIHRDSRLILDFVQASRDGSQPR